MAEREMTDLPPSRKYFRDKILHKYLDALNQYFQYHFKRIGLEFTSGDNEDSCRRDGENITVIVNRDKINAKYERFLMEGKPSFFWTNCLCELLFVMTVAITLDAEVSKAFVLYFINRPETPPYYVA